MHKVMSQSLCQLFIHLIFSTKQREKYITPEIEAELYKYLEILSLKLDTLLIQAGGSNDHLHLLIRFTKNSSLSGYLSIIKMQTSRWLKSNFKSCEKFAWQSGYGAFSVDVTRVDQITKYIANQREHHKRVSFQDEFRRFLLDHDVEYDERYLWD